MADAVVVQEEAAPVIVVTPTNTDPRFLRINEGTPGPRGPAGPPGPGGGSGLSITDVAYTHSQMIPSDLWTVYHNLSFTPNVTVVDSAGTVVEGDVRYISQYAVELSFSAGFSGTAYFS